MKKTILFFTIFFFASSFYLQAQETITPPDSAASFVYSEQCVSMIVTPALRDLEKHVEIEEGEKTPIVKNNFRRQKYTNTDAFPHGNDPIWQKEMGELNNRAPIQNWEGSDAGVFPPDPSGAAGPNHYVQMVNFEYIIYDKEGTILGGPNSLSSLLGVTGGDPIVLYDRFADRWILSAFGSGSQLKLAISTTPDPLGTYYLYTYSMGSFPDYPKYGLWHDGYYVTSNTSGPDCYVFERDKMLVGDMTASLIALDIPSLTTGSGTETGGFHSVMPAHADFELPPSDKKMNLFYFQDDAWTGIPDDAIKIWEVTIDWDAPESSDVSLIQTVLTTPFDSQFDSGWNDIEQPGTSTKLDAIPGAFMYRAQMTRWATHYTVMLNHTVDVDATNHAGIRWYELRENDGIWSIYQESTFAPDDDNRWMGSISMDYQGNIGMGYAVSGADTYPSIRYTGRYSTDPLNMFTIAEEVAIDGTSSQTGANRFGDYAHLSVDPTDNATFWYTGEYISGGRKTRIFSFKLASETDNDMGVSLLNTPIDGTLSATETINITLKNYGILPQDAFSVNYQINGGSTVTEPYSGGSISGGDITPFSFGTTADMSVAGVYNLKIWTELIGDENVSNDTLITSVTHLFPDDLGVTAILAPISSTSIGLENIEVSIYNFGSNAQSSFDIGFVLDGGTTVTETVGTSIAPGETMTYTFSSTADFSTLGIHTLSVFTLLDGDSDLTNDTTSAEIEHYYCIPSSTCSFGDGFTLFSLGSIENSTGCTSGGYTDYTDLSTNLARGMDHTLTVESGYAPQYVSVWIDFNDNFYFEADEKVVDALNSGLGSSTAITIPADALLGEHLLRGKSGFSTGGVNDPCSDFTYGETEDYTVNIIPGESEISVDFTADFIAVMPISTVSFTDLTTDDPILWDWTISPATGWVYTDGTTSASQNPKIIFNDIGLYSITLLASNDDGSGTETKTNYIEVGEFDTVVENNPFGLKLVQKENSLFEYIVMGSTKNFTIEVHNMMGKLIYVNTITPTDNKTSFTLDLSNQASGYYLLHVSDSDNSKIEKVLVGND